MARNEHLLLVFIAGGELYALINFLYHLLQVILAHELAYHSYFISGPVPLFPTVSDVALLWLVGL